MQDSFGNVLESMDNFDENRSERSGRHTFETDHFDWALIFGSHHQDRTDQQSKNDMTISDYIQNIGAPLKTKINIYLPTTLSRIALPHKFFVGGYIIFQKYVQLLEKIFGLLDYF